MIHVKRTYLDPIVGITAKAIIRPRTMSYIGISEKKAMSTNFSKGNVIFSSDFTMKPS